MVFLIFRFLFSLNTYADAMYELGGNDGFVVTIEQFERIRASQS